MSPLTFIFSHLSLSIPEASWGVCRFALGCLHGIVSDSSGQAGLRGSNQQFQNLRGLNKKGISLAHSSCPIGRLWALLQVILRSRLRETSIIPPRERGQGEHTETFQACISISLVKEVYTTLLAWNKGKETSSYHMPKG